MSLPFLIPEPFKEKHHGSCRWFLAPSDDGERLMIVRTYRACCFAEYNHSHCKVFEQDPSFSGPSGIFDWRLVSSLGTCSLFVGLNYPINQEIIDGKDHDGSAVSFIRQKCVYTAYHASLHAPYPDMCRHALQPKVGERVASIRLRPAGWSFPRQAPIWFKPSANLHSLINSNV